MVALIDAGGTIHTFQLSSVSNIYTGGAYIDALKTIDTISFSRRFAILIFSEFRPSRLLLTSFVIVGNNNRFIIQQNAL
jgi:hypothetical protein